VASAGFRSICGTRFLSDAIVRHVTMLLRLRPMAIDDERLRREIPDARATRGLRDDGADVVVGLVAERARLLRGLVIGSGWDGGP
jgi:hypothetical protein